MKRYIDFTCLWEKVPNGLLYDWLKFMEESNQRWRELLNKNFAERPLAEWRFLSEEASRKLWAMWMDASWNGSGQSERSCFITDLRLSGICQIKIEHLLDEAENLILHDPLPHITVHLAQIEANVNSLSSEGRPNFFVWSEFSFKN